MISSESPIEVIEKDATGAPIFNYKMTQQGVELLKGMSVSDSWKFYRTILLHMKECHTSSLLQENETNKVMILKGMIAGLNLAVNSLGHSIKSYEDKQARIVSGETRNHTQPKR